MPKFKFVTEFEIRASQKMLYPYIYTASGLTQWFADDVVIDEDKNFIIYWDGEGHKAQMVAHRTNKFVKYQFTQSEEEEEEAPNYVEFRLDTNDLTQSVFLRVTDFSTNEDEDELQDLWESMVHTLRETVGG